MTIENEPCEAERLGMVPITLWLDLTPTATSNHFDVCWPDGANLDCWTMESLIAHGVTIPKPPRVGPVIGGGTPPLTEQETREMADWQTHAQSPGIVGLIMRCQALVAQWDAEDAEEQS